MHPISKSLPTGLVLLTMLSSAQADWENTTWGMTPEEVIALGEGRIDHDHSFHPELLKLRGIAAILIETFVERGSTARQTYTFDADGLEAFSRQHFSSPNSDQVCREEYQELVERYGQPADMEDDLDENQYTTLSSWKSLPGGTSVLASLTTFHNIDPDIIHQCGFVYLRGG